MRESVFQAPVRFEKNTRNSSAELGGTSGHHSGSILALTCTLLFQSLHLSSSVSIFPGGGRSVSIFFILYRSKLQPENEFQVDLRCRRTPSRAATAIVINAETVTPEQEIYTPCQTATSEKSTGGAIIQICFSQKQWFRLISSTLSGQNGR